MKPPPPRSCRTSFRSVFRRRRSSSSMIFRETPTCSTVGMYTRYRPGSETCAVMRAPFCPSGSLTTWTRTSCPSFSISSIGELGGAAPPPPRPPARLPGVKPVRRAAVPCSGGSFLYGEEVLVELLEDVGHVEEGVALEAEVDERRLHAG